MPGYENEIANNLEQQTNIDYLELRYVVPFLGLL
jgi:hypothetical protein